MHVYEHRAKLITVTSSALDMRSLYAISVDHYDLEARRYSRHRNAERRRRRFEPAALPAAGRRDAGRSRGHWTHRELRGGRIGSWRRPAAGGASGLLSASRRTLAQPVDEPQRALLPAGMIARVAEREYRMQQVLGADVAAAQFDLNDIAWHGRSAGRSPTARL